MLHSLSQMIAFVIRKTKFWTVKENTLLKHLAKRCNYGITELPHSYTDSH